MKFGTKVLAALITLTSIVAFELIMHSAGIEGEWIWIIDLFGVLVGVASIIYILVAVIKPLSKFSQEVKEFSKGSIDFNHRLETDLGEFSGVAKSINRIVAGVSEAVETISNVADQVAAASNQLASSSHQISESSDRQANQAVEVATAMEEMTATVSEVARNATQVAEQAKVGTDLANQGAGIVRKTIESMETIANSVNASAATVEELGRRSAEVGQVISVISDIADLTNLLSLNAAIEAARAGEHGRGFAVVADEVRKLAEKTSQATNEVRDTIGATQKETGEAVEAMRSGTSDVQTGVDLASKAEHSLSDIVSSYVTVNDMVHQIATAAEEQSTTAEEIARHIDSIANLSREVTGGIGDTARASKELADLAESLRSQVARLGH